MSDPRRGFLKADKTKLGQYQDVTPETHPNLFAPAEQSAREMAEVDARWAGMMSSSTGAGGGGKQGQRKSTEERETDIEVPSAGDDEDDSDWEPGQKGNRKRASTIRSKQKASVAPVPTEEEVSLVSTHASPTFTG